MKTLKALSLGLAAAAAFTGTSAHAAPTIVRVAGSTAFRAPATASMIDYLSANNTATVYAAYDKSSSNLLGAAGAILANGTIKADGTGTATVIIETYWTGSLAGVVDLVAGNNVGNYIDPSKMAAGDITLFNNQATPVTVGKPDNSVKYGGGVQLATTDVKAGEVSSTLATYPQLAMSDSHKATIQTELATATLSSPITGDLNTYSTIAALSSAVGGSTVVNAGDPSNPGGTSSTASGTNANADGLVGVVPFVWVRGNGSPAAGTADSISQQAAKTIITQGVIDASLLTGVSGSGNSFYLTGRNEDSGTRIDSFSEVQFGVKTAPVQYNKSFVLYPANSTLNTETQISWAPAGHSGEASGGTVASNLSATEAGPKYLVGYLGVTDALDGAKSAVVNGAHLLKYNGIDYTVSNVQNGLYTLWGYEHAYTLSSIESAGGLTATTVNAIADNIHNVDADVAADGSHQSISGGATYSAGILYDLNFQVNRPVTPEGGPIGHF